MRSVGGAQHAIGFGAQDHLSWPYDDRADFLERACEFLRDGLDQGLRCIYAGEGPREVLESDLAGVPGLPAHLERGALTLDVLRDLYVEGEPVDPAETLATFATATDNALARGYAGLRIAADSTSLVRTPEQVAAFAAWEHAADRYMAGRPLSAMCGFDRGQVSDAAATMLAALHPAAREGTSAFQVFAPEHDADLALVGELDQAVAEEFRACLERIGLDATRELVVDGTGLEFADHRALRSLRDVARHSGTTVVLRTCSTSPSRLVDLLGLDGIRVEPVAPTGAGVLV